MNLSDLLRNPPFHALTCGGDRGDDAHLRYKAVHGGDAGELVMTETGLVCPVCGWKQPKDSPFNERYVLLTDEDLETNNCNLTVLSNHVGWNEKVWEDDKHYITMYTLGTIEGDPVVTEKDKCLGWRWFTSEELEGLELFEETNMKSILQEALKGKSQLQEAVKFLLDNIGKPTPYWPLTESGKHIHLVLSFVNPDWNKIKSNDRNN